MIPEPQQKSPQTSSKLTLFNSIKESHIGRNVVFEDKTLPVAEQIKSHLFSIHEQLEQLVEIAQQVDGDKPIIDKIKAFYGEVLLDFLLRFTDSHKKLRIVSLHDNPEQHAPGKSILEKDFPRAFMLLNT